MQSDFELFSFLFRKILHFIFRLSGIIQKQITTTTTKCEKHYTRGEQCCSEIKSDRQRQRENIDGLLGGNGVHRRKWFKM